MILYGLLGVNAGCMLFNKMLVALLFLANPITSDVNISKLYFIENSFITIEF